MEGIKLAIYFVLFIYFHIINFKILKIREKNIFFKIISKRAYVFFYFSLWVSIWSVPHCCDKNYSFLYDKLVNILF